MSDGRKILSTTLVAEPIVTKIAAPIVTLVMALIAALIVIATPQKSFSYPDFIGYGYGSCLTCHYNGLGNGPINDYGRGVLASEIAAQALSSKATLEEVSASSGFLGSKQLPRWIRPHIKYRGINVKPNPGSSDDSYKSRFVHMQLDMGATIPVDEDQRWLIMFNWGYIPYSDPARKNDLSRIMARDYFFRKQFGETTWFYVGKMEKAFGIRNIDHTSYNRGPLELTQNAQTHGVIGNVVGEKAEFALHYFVGDLNSTDKDREQAGTSIFSEFEVGEKKRVGVSLLQSKSKSNDARFFVSAHWKQGLSLGTSLIFEYGYLQKKSSDFSTGAITTTNGSFTFLETMIRLTRGYHFMTNIERFNSDVSARSADNWKIGMGFMMYPIQRIEFRVGAYHMRSVSAEFVTPDSWVAQGQIHVSL